MQVSPEAGGDVWVGTYLQEEPSKDYSCVAQEDLRLEAVPARGYRFDHWEGAATGSENPASLSYTRSETVTAVFEATLYFPHIDTTGRWETEICIINKSQAPVSGDITAYSRTGGSVAAESVTLQGNERRAYQVGEDFADPDEIRYILFSGSSGEVCGYTKFWQKGLHRVAVPAVRYGNTDDIYVPHIASDEKWWTGLALVNTGDSKRSMTVHFSTGDLRSVSLEAGEHESFTVRSLFKELPQPQIESAVIKGGGGVIGLELFSGEGTLSGVLLQDAASETLYFPHIASDDRWWTGIAAYNPWLEPAELTVTPYRKSGDAMEGAAVSQSLGPREKYIGDIRELALPREAAWIRIDASRPLNGFELFGSKKAPQLAGYSAVDIRRRKGVFPKLEDAGWTGIAFVNTTERRVKVHLRLFDDGGEEMGYNGITLDGHEKILEHPEDIFGGPIPAATYIQFSSEEEVVGFQLNGGDEGAMLDALPGM